MPNITAESLGIKALLPTFLDPNLRSDDLASDVSFASGGSGFDKLTVQIQNVLSMTDQFNLFKQYIEKLERSVGQEKARAIVFESLYLVSSSNNDIGLRYIAGLRIDINAYTTLLVSSASTFIKDMYGLGARKFGYLSTLPVGCLPIARTIAVGNCVEVANQAATLFNSKLKVEINNLETNLPGATIGFIDVYNPLLGIIQNPNKYGFDDSTHACCGTGTIEFSYLCNRFNPFTCSNTSSHVFWDALHPSERAYMIILSRVLDQIP